MRLFFGLSLPPHIAREISLCTGRCRTAIPGRYVPEENYHITLAFLGDVPESRAGDASDVLAACLARFPAPRLTLGPVSYFGRAQNAILIARVHSEPSLDPLHHVLIDGLAAAGLPFDPGPFSPHITLARHARTEGLSLPRCAPLSFIPAQAHLYLSARNAQDILCYTPIQTVSFPSASEKIP